MSVYNAREQYYYPNHSQETKMKGGDERALKILSIEATVGVLLFLAIIDIWKSRIPNALVLLLILLQVIFEALSILIFSTPLWSDSAWSELSRVFMCLCIVVFLYPFFLSRKLGAGDIKLIAVTAFGVASPLLYLLWIFALSAAEAIFIIVLNRMKKKERHLWGKDVIHLALPILAAYVISICMFVGR